MRMAVLLVFLLVLMLSGCVQQIMKQSLMMAGVTEEELEELGLGSLFGVQKVEKKKETRVEAPRFVGMDILLVKAPKYTSPGAYEDIDILIGNNYYGSTAGNLNVTVFMPFGFSTESILAASESPPEITGPTKNVVKVSYKKMEYGDGDVITMSVKVPEREETANVRYYYPIKITMDYWYSILLKENIPAVSSSYYRALGGEINKTTTIDSTAGEVMISPRKEIGVIRIPDDFFDGESIYNKTLVFKIQNVGKGVVLRDYRVYFLGFYKKGVIDISLVTKGSSWVKIENRESEAEKLEKIGLDYAAEIIRNAPVVYAVDISKYSESFSATLSIKVSPALQSTVFEIPAIFLVVYDYEISKDIYIRIEKVMP